MGCFLTYTEADAQQAAWDPNQFSAALASSWLAARAGQIASAFGKAVNEMGREGERAAASVVAQELGYTVRSSVDSRGQGVDLTASGPPGSTALQTVHVEVKTTLTDKTFPQLLQDYRGERQGSDGWLSAVGVDPAAPVVGVLVNAQRETVSIYNRLDADAREWTPIAEDVPLSLYEELGEWGHR